MAIQTSVKRSFILWNVLYIVLCGGLGAWGAYDYWVTIPDQEAAVVEYEELSARRAALAAAAGLACRARCDHMRHMRHDALRQQHPQ